MHDLSFYGVHMVEKYHHFACCCCLLLDFLLSHTKHLLWTLLLSSFTFVLVPPMHSPILPRKCLTWLSDFIIFIFLSKIFFDEDNTCIYQLCLFLATWLSANFAFSWILRRHVWCSKHLRKSWWSSGSAEPL